MILCNRTCVDTPPKQCRECVLLKQCTELNCLKRSSCKSRTTETNDVSDEMRELAQTLILR